MEDLRATNETRKKSVQGQIIVIEDKCRLKDTEVKLLQDELVVKKNAAFEQDSEVSDSAPCEFVLLYREYKVYGESRYEPLGKRSACVYQGQHILFLWNFLVKESIFLKKSDLCPKHVRTSKANLESHFT
ncbi:hypothetical protein DPMN_090729 [Dreissena polymorpha]|uniref:Uncharacterized protein n=1 Tax=Dreissena polymorpha TaxID=45954 RepID=A0A9D4QZA0_DREPO|nr:hypothetical protein DPMN_090729 [Dreissena polymorpha]